MSLYKTLTDKGPTAAFVLGAVGVAIAIFSLLSNSAALSVADAAKQSATIAQSGALDIAFGITALFLAICVITIAVYGVMHLFTDLKGSFKALAGIAVIAIVFFAAYSMADTETSVSMTRLMERFSVSDGQSRFISGAMVTALLLSGLAVASFVVFEILNFFK